jgi:hypothetical protein
MCCTLRLHMSAAPPRVGLTQALGGRKTFVFRRRFAGLSTVPLIAASLPFSAASLIAFVSHALLWSVCGARSNFACVTLAGIGNADWLSVSLSVPDAVASETSGKVRRARSGLTASAFGRISLAHASPASTAA